jgi:hypothetical protein
VLAFPGVSRIFPADAALGLSARIIGEKNTAVNRIFGQGFSAKKYILTNRDPETIQFLHVILRKCHPSGISLVAQRGQPQIRISRMDRSRPRLCWWKSGHLWPRKDCFLIAL